LRGLAAAAALCAVALLLAACGDDAGDGTSTASAAASGESTAANDQDAARVRLQECLREQGIDLPDDVTEGGGPPPGGADIDQEKLQEAFEGPCKDEQEAALGDIGEEDQQELQDQLTKLTDCLRGQGLDVPDIRLDGGAPSGGVQLDRDDPKVREATEACQDELPAGGPGGGADQ
jgi:hypothetical protein